MRRNWALIVIVACVLAAAGVVGLVAVLLNTGVVSVVSTVSSGEMEDAKQRPAGYVGKIVARGAVGALSEPGLDSNSGVKGPVLAIPGGTKARVLISHEDDCEVELLDGSEKGKKPWIRWVYLE